MCRQLNDLLNLSSVPRWGIARMTWPQSVAEHSHRVAAIAIKLCHDLDKDLLMPHVALWAVLHDATESITGDPPSPFKDALGHEHVNTVEATFCPWVKDEKRVAGPRIMAIVKLADVIEGYTWWRLAGDVRMNHQWIRGGNPVACNRDTVKLTCMKYVDAIGADPERLVTTALIICGTILHGSEYDESETFKVASQSEAQAYVRGH